ncbi:hypothetical protein [Dactylosporangium darangshiense]|uniref:hypothetical protein n=1 Tax=Dactylosporangium darangshiense TaxID=579108 RepID=UPI00363A8B65
MRQFRTLAMRVRSPEASAALTHAAQRIGLPVEQLPGDPAEVNGLHSADGVAWRAAGGYLTTLIAGGADVCLSGASPSWFAALPKDVTGRDIRLVSVGEAPDVVGPRPAVAKLADEKHPAFSAAWVRNADDLRNRLRTARLPADSTLIIMDHWLDLASSTASSPSAGTRSPGRPTWSRARSGARRCACTGRPGTTRRPPSSR